MVLYVAFSFSVYNNITFSVLKIGMWRYEKYNPKRTRESFIHFVYLYYLQKVCEIQKINKQTSEKTLGNQQMVYCERQTLIFI